MDYEKMWNELKDDINKIDDKMNGPIDRVGSLHHLLKSLLRLMNIIEDRHKENGGNVL